MTSDPATTSRVRTLASAATIAILFALQLASMARYLDRALDHDEAQYLHDGWLMHEGRQLYRDFEENHSPLLFAWFSTMVPSATTPEFPRLDVITYAERARIAVGICGLLAVAFLALIAWRLTNEPLAAAIVTLLIFGTSWTWRTAVACARNDPPTLMLFWLGALLLLSRRRHAVVDGLAIGCVAVAALWNPKYPITSLVLGAIFLMRSRRQLLAALIPPIVMSAATLAIIASLTPLRDYFLFTFRFNAALGQWFARAPLVNAFWFEDELFRYAGWPFKWWIVTCVLIAALSFRAVRARVKPAWPAFALLIAAAIEMRFLMSWPNLWPQYYLLWSFATALVFAVIASTMLRRNDVAFVAMLIIIAIGAFRIMHPDDDIVRDGTRAWARLSFIQQHLGANDTVWLDALAHPIAARDATWYWYGLGDIVPFSLQYRALPRVSESELPLCRAERGLDTSLRFVGVPPSSLPESRNCLARMMAAKRVVRTPFTNLLYILSPSPAAREKVPRSGG